MSFFDLFNINIPTNKVDNTTPVKPTEVVGVEQNHFSNIPQSQSINLEVKYDLEDEKTQNLLYNALENQVNLLNEEYKTAKKSNGWISGAWDWAKDTFNFGASSEKAQDEINKAKNELEKVKNKEIDIKEAYKNITGKEPTDDEIEQLLNGEISLKDISKAGESLNNYQEGQKMSTDVVADIVSGIASVGVVAFGTALGVCAAPFTAGASLGAIGAGVALAAGTGAAVKSAIKASDCIGNEKQYSGKDALYDVMTGSFNGAMGPISNGAGGAIGTGIMKLAGMEALETTAKTALKVAGGEVVEEIIEESAEAVAKNTGKTLLQKGVTILAKGFDMATDGTLSGAADGFSRAAAEGRWEDIPQDTLNNAVMGFFASPIIGSGFNIAGKAGTKLANTKAGEAIKELVFDNLSKAGDYFSDLAHQYTPNLANSFDNLGVKINDKLATTAINNAIVKNSDDSLSVTIGDYVINVASDEIPDEIKGDNLKIYSWLCDGVKKYETNPSALFQVDSNSTADLTEIKATQVYDFSNRFTQKETDELIQKYQQNPEKLIELCELKNDDNYKYSSREILQLAKSVEISPELTLELCTTGNYTPWHIDFILQNHSDKQELILNLIKIKDSYDNSLFMGNDLIEILNMTPVEQNRIINFVQADSSLIATRFRDYNTIQKILQIYGDNYRVALELGGKTTYNGQLFFQNSDIENIGNILKAKPQIALEFLATIDSLGYQQFADRESFLNFVTRNLSNLDEKQLQNALFLFKAGKTDGLDTLATLEDEQLQNAHKFIKSLVSEKVYELATLEGEQLQNAFKAIDAGIYDGKFILELSQIANPNKMDTVLELASEFQINTPQYLKALVNLEEAELQNAISFMRSTNSRSMTLLQNEGGINIAKTKTSESQPIWELDNQQNIPEIIRKFYNLHITKKTTLLEDGNIVKDTEILRPSKTHEAWLQNSDTTILLKHTDNSDLRDILYQIEIKNNAQGEPSEIISTKASDVLAGAYETTTYRLKDYPEDFDILTALQDGTIEQKISDMSLSQGKKTSNVTINSDGSINYIENHSRNGNNIQRNYTQKTDLNNNPIQTNYTYRITSENGKSLLSLNRSWVKNDDGTTTTIINGKKYVTSFDDAIAEIKIIQDDGIETKLALKDLFDSKYYYEPKELEFIEATYESLEKAQEVFYEYCKTLPADNLLAIAKNINSIHLVEDGNASFNVLGQKLRVNLNLATISHELGHSTDTPYIKNISNDEELIKIYQDEFLTFKKEYPKLAQEIIDYFSQNGGSSGTGLSELVAETNMLMTTYGQQQNGVTTRSQYLVRYFPQTVAKAGELLGYNNVSSLDIDFTSVDYKKLTPEQIVQCNDSAIELSSRYNAAVQSIKDTYNKIFGTENKVSARGKSPKSTLEKIIAKQEKGELAEITIEHAARLIGDGYGIRVQMPSLTKAQSDSIVNQCLEGTGKTQAQFQKLIDDGKFTELLADDDFKTTFEILKETRSQGVVDDLIYGIKSKQIVPANGKDDYFNNYGSEITSYLTNAQLIQIDNAYYETYGKHLTFVNKTPVEIPNDTLEMSPEAISTTKPTNTQKAEKPSGYANAQFNVATNHTNKNNPLSDMEVQFRGVEVHKVAEVEHIPYDVRQGKITASNPKYAQYYTPLKGMSPESCIEYNEYLNKTYIWACLKELNLTTDAQKPKLDFELFYGDVQYLQTAGIDINLANKKFTAEELEKITIEGLKKYKAK